MKDPGAPLSVMSQVIVEQCSGPLPPVQCALALSCSFLWLLVVVTNGFVNLFEFEAL